MARQQSATSLVIPYAEFPRDAPRPSEGRFLVVSVGNTHYNWVMHSLFPDGGGAAECIWRTPAPGQAEMKDPPALSLRRHLPEQTMPNFFGPREDQLPVTKDTLERVSARRDCPPLSVYVVSTNQQNEKGLAYIFSDMPCRLVKLRNSDLLTPELGLYETMGVDRAAEVRAAATQYPGRPVLVIDGGTAMTYSAVNKHGKFIGGGIGPGLKMRFEALQEGTGSLPLIKPEDYKDFIMRNAESPSLKTFEQQDTKSQMMGSVFTEMACKLRALVTEFLAATTGRDAEMNQISIDGDDEATKPVIALAGGDSPAFEALLRHEHGGVVQSTAFGSDDIVGKVIIHRQKYLIASGVNDALLTRMEEAAKIGLGRDEELRNMVTGLRVAKKFREPDYDGVDVYRGTIINCAPDHGRKFEEDAFKIRFDDGDSETMKLDELIECLELYVKEGEKPNKTPPGLDHMKDTAPKIAERQAKSFGAVQKIQKECPEIVEGMKAKEQTQPAPAAQASSTNGSSSAKKRDSTSPKAATGGAAKKKKRVDPKEYLGRRVAKWFDDGTGSNEMAIFFGTVDQIKTEDGGTDMWHITYEDDDDEDVYLKELLQLFRLYSEHGSKDSPSRGKKT